MIAKIQTEMQEFWTLACQTRFLPLHAETTLEEAFHPLSMREMEEFLYLRWCLLSAVFSVLQHKHKRALDSGVVLSKNRLLKNKWHLRDTTVDLGALWLHRFSNRGLRLLYGKRDPLINETSQNCIFKKSCAFPPY